EVRTMFDVLGQFVWSAPKGGGGYAWEIRRFQSNLPFSVENEELSLVSVPGATFRSYSPFGQFPGLFRRFADTELSEEAVLGFANGFGLLGKGLEIEGVSQTKNNPREGQGVAEPFSGWKRQILLMGEMVSLWDAARDLDMTVLRERIRWEGSGCV